MAQTGYRTVSGKQKGFTYIALLIAVAIIGATLAAVGQVWQTLLQRDREQNLIFIGNQFRQAIDRYYASNRRFPMNLDDLLIDSREAGIKRYLRKIFIDPMTHQAQWGLVTLQDGQIVGVHSLSEIEPLKKSGFRLANESLENKDKYSEWVFMTAVRGATQILPLSNAPAKTPTTPSPPSRRPGTFAK